VHSREITRLTEEVANALYPWYVSYVEEKTNIHHRERMIQVLRLTEQALCQQAMSQQVPSVSHAGELPQQRRCGKQPDYDAYSSGMASSTIAASDAESVVSISSGDEDFERRGKAKTTMMMRNIPNVMTRAMLADLLNDQGFRGSFDFVYLPIDHSTNIGFGYAFVNFTTAHGARLFKDSFHGFSDWSYPCDKTCEVVWSQAHQGLQEHIDRLRNSPVMHESVPEMFKPAIYVNGLHVPFPQPTKKPRAPRIRHLPPVSEVQRV